MGLLDRGLRSSILFSGRTYDTSLDTKSHIRIFGLITVLSHTKSITIILRSELKKDGNVGKRSISSECGRTCYLRDGVTDGGVIHPEWYGVTLSGRTEIVEEVEGARRKGGTENSW